MADSTGARASGNTASFILWSTVAAIALAILIVYLLGSIKQELRQETKNARAKADRVETKVRTGAIRNLQFLVVRTGAKPNNDPTNRNGQHTLEDFRESEREISFKPIHSSHTGTMKNTCTWQQEYVIDGILGDENHPYKFRKELKGGVLVLNRAGKDSKETWVLQKDMDEFGGYTGYLLRVRTRDKGGELVEQLCVDWKIVISPQGVI